MSHVTDNYYSINEMHSPASRFNELRRFLGYMDPILFAGLSDAVTSIHCAIDLVRNCTFRQRQDFTRETMAYLFRRRAGTLHVLLS